MSIDAQHRLLSQVVTLWRDSCWNNSGRRMDLIEQEGLTDSPLQEYDSRYFSMESTLQIERKEAE